jgi:hypothetical protein
MMDSGMDDMSEPLFTRRFILGGAALITASSLVPDEAFAAMSRENKKMYRAIPKSLWIWRTSLQQLPDVLEYAKRWNIGTLFYSVPPREREGLKAIDSTSAKLINKIRRQDGLKFVALTGDPKWAWRGKRMPKAIQNLINIHRHTGGLFDGLQLDVEPQALKAWRGAKRRDLAEGYYQLIKTVSRQTKDAKLPLSAATHPAYARVAVPSLGSSMLKSVMPYLDEVGLMAYRNNPRSTFRISSLTIKQLAVGNTRWWLGVTTQNSRVAHKISYFGKSQDYFLKSLSQLDTMAKACRARKTYAGIAIQHYKTVTLLTGR